MRTVATEHPLRRTIPGQSSSSHALSFQWTESGGLNVAEILKSAKFFNNFVNGQLFADDSAVTEMGNAFTRQLFNISISIFRNQHFLRMSLYISGSPTTSIVDLSQRSSALKLLEQLNAMRCALIHH